MFAEGMCLNVTHLVLTAKLESIHKVKRIRRTKVTYCVLDVSTV